MNALLQRLPDLRFTPQGSTSVNREMLARLDHFENEFQFQIQG